MVHLEDATVQFAAVVNSVEFVVAAVATQARSPIVATDKDVLAPEVLDALGFISGV